MRKPAVLLLLSLACLAFSAGFRPAFADDPPASAAPATAASDDIRSTGFKFQVNGADGITPSTISYTKGTGNIPDLLGRIASVLLVVVSTGAVLLIVVGGFMMAISAGDSDRATKGRTIITHNIQALVVAMLAYGIVRFVAWIITP